jgi:phenylpropionate dioxygenase-like ring-hydroxylating dioxygenase large terminal subunit
MMDEGEDPAMGHVPAVAELLDQVAIPFERARTMPPSVYTSPEFLDREIRDIFAKEWFSPGRASRLAKPGDYMSFELANQPIFVIRGKDGGIRAFSNVCLHRMSTLLEGEGNRHSIVCPYHAWTYDIDGRLRAAPAMVQNRAFDAGSCRLPEIRCEEWLGWILVTLNKDAPPPAKVLESVSSLVGDYQMENYVESFRETLVWNTNWKILAENFMESYHLPKCHADTIGPQCRLDEMVCPPGLKAFNYHWILKDNSLALTLAHPTNTRLEGDRRRTTFLLSIYPSLLITLSPGYFWYLSLHPRGVGQVTIIFGGGMAPEFANSPEAQTHFSQLKELLDRVNVEDKGCTERVYRGVCAGSAKAGHLSHLERPNYEFAQYLAEKVGGFKRTCPELAV